MLSNAKASASATYIHAHSFLDQRQVAELQHLPSIPVSAFYDYSIIWCAELVNSKPTHLFSS